MVELLNGYYGHREILVQYTGVQRSVRHVPASIQHGWTTMATISLRGQGRLGYPLITRLVWSVDQSRRAAAAGIPNIVVAGAPWGYLTRRLADQRYRHSTLEQVRPSATAVVAYPFHSDVRERTDDFHGEYARQLREVEGGEVTVVLHPMDSANPDIIEAYSALGHRVTCHGSLYDPDFLLRQLQTLEAHERVVANRLSTAVWYGVERGLEPDLYGPEAEIHLRSGLTPTQVKDPRDLYRDTYAHLYSGAALDVWQRTCREELGLDHLLEPGSMAQILGLQGTRRTARLLYSAAAELRLRAKAKSGGPNAGKSVAP